MVPVMSYSKRHTTLIKTLPLAILVTLTLSACSPSSEIAEQDIGKPAQSLTEWLDAQYEEELLFSPIDLTFLGRKELNSEIDPFTYAAFAE